MKTNQSIFKILALGFLAVTLFSCAKEEEVVELPEVRSGFYILNEGGFNSNNSSLDFYNLENSSLVSNFFTQKNSRGLGDTGNDAQVYGSKLYIVVNASNTVEIVNAKTAVSIKQLDFKINGKGRQPRFVIFNKNKAFVSSYDGTVAVIDTTSLAIEKYIQVGRNPEQMAIANNKIYVANSGGLDYPNYDKTVSVIDLATLTVTKTITVVENPRGVTATADGKVYVKSTGNYGTIKASLSIIDSNTDLVISSKEFTGSKMTIVGEKAYFLASTGIREYDLKTDAITKENMITDGTTYKIGYGLNYDKVNQQFFVCDAQTYSGTGVVLCFDKNGKLLYKVNAGVLPNNVIFLNK
jgi:YVTN family beta-propeller protein